MGPFLAMSEESFRDSIATINAEGKRNKIFPKKVSGRFATARRYVAWFLLVVLFTAPWISIGGQPMFMIDVIDRKFVLLGQIFRPADTIIFVLLMISGVVSVIVFTVAFGRIFCGWICPQTIFLEQVYRRIEYWIEGDRNRQLKLDRQNWNFEKIWKKGVKNVLFYAIAFVVSNVFLQYLVGVDRWKLFLTEGPAQHLGTFSAIVVFSFIFYLVFAWFREQACIVVCPYGRLQGVLLDRNSLVIIYDWIRGEPRAKGKRKTEESPKGDCVDCGLCVQVCPTGIDIRNGTQLECVNCTACIDVCDSVMEKVGLEPGLIRFDSTNGVEQGKRNILTPRVWTYIGVMIAMMGVVITMLATRSEVETMVMRMPGKLFEKNGTTIENAYNFTVINKTDAAKAVYLELLEPVGTIRMTGGDSIRMTAEDIVHGAMIVAIEREVLEAEKTKVIFRITDNKGHEIDRVKTNFLGPLVRK